MSRRVLRELLDLDLVYRRRLDELDFTPVGEKAYDELKGAAEPAEAETL
jgi:hypothetical protein